VLAEIGGINQLHKGQVETGRLRRADKRRTIPSILVETAFISNPDEEKRLTDDAYQDTMAAAIVAGIQALLRQKPAAGAEQRWRRACDFERAGERVSQ